MNPTSRPKSFPSVDSLMVLLLVAVAGIFVFFLHMAMNAQNQSTERSFIAAFDDATGIKLRSNVLFKGIPVGTVGALDYDIQGKKALVRIDLQKDVPDHIQPYLVTSLMGEANVDLDTAREDDPGYKTPLPQKGAWISKPPVVDGIKQEFSPQIDMVVKMLKSTLQTAQSSLETAQSLTNSAQGAIGNLGAYVNDFKEDINTRLVTPLQSFIEQIDTFVNGQDGSNDPNLRASLRDVTNDLKADSDSLQRILDGKDGLIKLIPVFSETAKSLKKAGDVIASSKGQFQKIGTAGTDVSKLSKEFTSFGERLQNRPQMLIWGPGKASPTPSVAKP
jgi:ABC-type transporter Mla subunit MlaD